MKKITILSAFLLLFAVNAMAVELIDGEKTSLDVMYPTATAINTGAGQTTYHSQNGMGDDYLTAKKLAKGYLGTYAKTYCEGKSSHVILQNMDVNTRRMDDNTFNINTSFEFVCFDMPK